MTAIVLGPAEVLSRALSDEIAGVTVVDVISDAGATMWNALVALQAARLALTPPGGQIVVVLPTIGIAGSAGLVGYTTAVEGIRAMAKSAARQWLSEGIRVNMVGAPVRIFAPGLAGCDEHLTAAAVQDDSGLVHSVVATTKFLLRSDITHVVGETVIVDGGSVMLP